MRSSPPLRAIFAWLAAPSLAIAQASEGKPAGEELPLVLDWKAPPECATEGALRSELSRIARVKPGRAVSPLTARGRIEKQGDLYRLHLRTERNGEKGERSLSAPECRPLEREVTLVLALAFGEGVELVEPAPAAPGDAAPGSASAASARGAAEPSTEPQEALPPVVPEAAKVPAAATPAPRTAEAPPRKPARVPLAAVLGGGVELGALPSPSPMVTAGLDVGTETLWLAPRFLWLFGVEQELPRGVVAEYSGLGGSLSGCAGVPAASFVLGGCAGASALALRGASRGATESGGSTAAWYAATASAFSQWPARSVLSVRLEALLGVSLNTPYFVVEGLATAHDVPRLTGSVSAGFVIAPWRR